MGRRRDGILRRESQLTPATAALTLRKATLEDGPFLLRIRNDDDVRLQSKNQHLISAETHRCWLERHLNSAVTAVWIIERAEEQIGYVRAEHSQDSSKTGTWLLSIALIAFSRGKGYGAWAVTEACRLLREDFGARAIVVDVLNKNAAALKLFKRTGFKTAAIVQEHSQTLQRLELPLTR